VIGKGSAILASADIDGASGGAAATNGLGDTLALEAAGAESESAVTAAVDANPRPSVGKPRADGPKNANTAHAMATLTSLPLT
jgi:hypothetical protein